MVHNLEKPPLTPFQAIIFHKNMVFSMVFPHLCGRVHRVHHESHVEIDRFQSTRPPRNPCVLRSREDLRSEMHGMVWRMEMVAVSEENVHFRRSKFAGIVME